ncbi:MAG TPA: AI-2E family transporter YdiK, partial [Vicinamibacterales bacterium]
MPERQRTSIDVTHATLSVLFLAFLIVTTVWVLSPFLTGILWATIIVVALWPFLLRLEGYVGGSRGVAVAIMTVMILLAVFVPVTLALVTIARNAQSFGAGIQSIESIPVPDPPQVLEDVPFAGRHLADRWRRFAALSPEERSAVITPHAQTALQWFAVKAGSVGTMLLQFLLTTIISAILFARGEMVRDAILAFARRLAGQQGHDVAVKAAQAIRGVVLGVVVTALVQAALAGTGLFLSGIPGAALLTAVSLFFCLAQIGPIPIVLPAVIWMYWSGQAGGATILLIFGLVAGTIDNVIRPVLIRRGANLPLLLIFGGVIGGLIAFGVIGLFIGPVVLTVAYTLLGTWVYDPARSSGEAAEPAHATTGSFPS